MSSAWFARRWLVAGTIASAAALASAEPVNLEVKRVIVYSSGVAYFERSGQVQGSALAELAFRTTQINDILKSLVVQDLGGGSVGVVRYASQEPIERALRSFGVDISGKPTLAQLLDQLRGEPVEIRGDRTLSGVIVGVEKRRIAEGQTSIDVEVLTIMTPEGIEQLLISELGRLHFKNPRINEELMGALSALAASHDADKKRVTLSFDGQGERRVRVAYLLEAPIWKTSYRLALSEDQPPFLQGWATVENATEEDWKDVSLTLVSGRPISFQMDLYTPLYVPRPVVVPELYQSLRPQTYEGNMLVERGKAPAERPAAPVPPASVAARRMQLEAPGRMADAVVKEQSLYQDNNDEDAAPGLSFGIEGTGVASAADASELGELFQYSIRGKQSIGRRQSAMLPIVNEPVQGEKLSIYNPAAHAKHPLAGLRVTNTSNLHLMQGPVTVFDGGAYAGDARLPDLRPGEPRLISYALDLGVEVATEQKSSADEVFGFKISQGVLHQKRRAIDTRTYRIRNKSEKEKIVLVEQMYSNDWNLLEPAKPDERTERLSRFRVAAKPMDVTPLTVKLERVLEETYAIASIDDDFLLLVLKNNSLTPAMRTGLQELVRLRGALAEATRAREQAEAGMRELAEEQERLRKNLTTLDRSTDAHKRQLSKFDETETLIEKQRVLIQTTRATEQERRAALEKFVAELELG